MEGKQIRRSATNQVIAGVCGGIGEYFDVDPTVIRVIFIILAFATGSGVILYILLWLLIPGSTSTATAPSETTFKEGLHEMEHTLNEVKTKIEKEAKDFKQEQALFAENASEKDPSKGYSWLGIGLVLVGGWLFLDNFGLLDWIRLERFWPVLLIVLGVYFLTKKD